jgi:hypothetical protein
VVGVADVMRQYSWLWYGSCQVLAMILPAS